MLWWLVGGGLFVLWVFVLHPLLAVRTLSQTIFLPSSFRIVTANELPPAASDPLIAAQKFLLSMGFKPYSHLLRGPVALGQTWGIAAVLMYLPKMNTWACAYVEPVGDGVLPWKLTFLTPLENRVLVTDVANSLRFNKETEGVVQNPDIALLPSEQWVSHREFLRNFRGERLRALTISEVLQKIEYIGFRAMQDLGRLKAKPPGFQLSYALAKKLSNNHRSTLKQLIAQKSKKLKQASREFGKFSQAARTKIDLAAYHALTAVESRRQATGFSKTLVLLASVVLFAAAFGLVFSWQTVVILILVLFIHEAGHLVGMWLFGYKNLRMLFIPFLGALASGKNEKSTAMQEAIVLLLGPLPGYVLGLYLLTDFGDVDNVWLVQFALISIILNLLNLLPFFPLDGGRLVSLALFSIYPKLQLGFSVLSMLAFAAAAYYLQEPVFFFLALILFASFSATRHEADLTTHLLKRSGAVHANDVPKLLFSLQTNDHWNTLAPLLKYHAFAAIKERLRFARTKLSTRLGILLLWFGAIVIPPATFAPTWVWSALGSITQMTDGIGSERMINEYDKTQDPLQRALLAINIAITETTFDKQAGLHWWSIAKQATTQLVDVDERVTATLALAEQCTQYEPESCFRQYHQSALQLATTEQINQSSRLTVLFNMAHQDGYSVDARIEYLNEARTLASMNDSLQNFAHLIDAKAAELLEQSGQFAKAEQALVRVLKLAEDQDTDYALSQLLEFYFRQGMLAKGQRLISVYSDSAKRLDSSVTDLSDQFAYRVVWFYSQTDVFEAQLQLDTLLQQKPNHIELLLAEQYLRQQQGLAIETDKFPVDPIPNEFLDNEDIIYLANRIYYHTNTIVAVDETETSLDQRWYLGLEDLLQSSEFAHIYRALEAQDYFGLD